MSNTSLLPVSIIVCTRNRAESLGRTLAALARLDVSSLPAVELVIVDNGSTDGTAELVRAAAGSFPYPMRLVSFPEKGLSRARNAGVAEARHALILFTDDDCLPEPDWAVRLAEAYGGDQLQVIGGRVVDVAEGETPGLTPPPADPRGAERLDRLERTPLFMIGANFSFGSAVVSRIGLFDPRLGAGTPLHAAEETDFVYRAFRAGIPVRYDPSAVVWHDHRRDAATLRRMLYGYTLSEGAMAVKHLRHDGGLYLRAKYWSYVSEIRKWRRGETTLADLVRLAVAYLDGAARMAFWLGRDRLQRRPSPHPGAAPDRPADRTGHA